MIRENQALKRWPGTMALLALLLLLSACAAKPTTAPPALSKNADGYVKISAAQLSAMLEKKDFTLVNVHIPYEGEIAQTDLLIPYNEIGNRAELPGKTARLVLYCRSGAMSTTAAKTLVSLGYTQVYELDGGMNAWQSAGKSLVNR